VSWLRRRTGRRYRSPLRPCKGWGESPGPFPGSQRGAALGLSEAEVAFYNALAANDSAGASPRDHFAV